MDTPSDPSLPLMQNLPRAPLPSSAGDSLILASTSPRRMQLLNAAGYAFRTESPDDDAECGICTKETPAETVARYAFRKASSVVQRMRKKQGNDPPALVLAADTVAACRGQVLGKPVDRDHAKEMLQLLSGTEHTVLSGICLWATQPERCVVDVVTTRLQMDDLQADRLEAYLDTELWYGKAGSFGYQDGIDWVEVLDSGSESNVVGLPMERLAELLVEFDRIAKTPEELAIEST